MEPRRRRRPPLLLLQLCIFFLFFFSSYAVDFLFNSFSSESNGTDFILISDARFDSPVIRLNNDSNQNSIGRVFYHTKLTMKPTSNSSTISSFSTSFVFSILLEVATSPGFGLAFVLSNSTSPPGVIAGQYFGLFTNATTHVVAPLLAVEFDTGRNTEFNDPDDSHIGIDLNSVLSSKIHGAGYFDSNGQFIPIQMRNGQNLRAWIEFDGATFEINVTVAPIGIPRPSIPTLSFRDPLIANYVSTEMFVGFSASKTKWVEAQRILAWSFSDTGVARDINTTNFPVFMRESPPSPLSPGSVAGIVIGCILFSLTNNFIFLLSKMSECYNLRWKLFIVLRQKEDLKLNLFIQTQKNNRKEKRNILREP